ncbi:hypothetical protein [uncultured Bosea sp.]|uniref:hypothetical protein n=1 Tax=uncultured Bosea sp. TaxID=211457 RepID=UPI00263A8D32|nr:hypothetical protein [uncultured Bosea sp.]
MAATLFVPGISLDLIWPSPKDGHDTLWTFLLREAPATLALAPATADAFADEMADAAHWAEQAGIAPVENGATVAYPTFIWRWALFPSSAPKAAPRKHWRDRGQPPQ